MKFVIAIDGPAAAGKGTIAQAVAAHFGFAHLDTGLLYRAVARRMLDGQDPERAAIALTSDDITADDLRTPEIAQAASEVAALPPVRAALVDFQRQFARRAGGAVLDGREIATVICPKADVKLFVTASPEARARRRLQELATRGIPSNYKDVLDDIKARDDRDAHRKDAPMARAKDAILLETSALSQAQAISQAIAIVCQISAHTISGVANSDWTGT